MKKETKPVILIVEDEDSIRLTIRDFLKKKGYRRTHNYRLLKSLVEQNLIRKEGDGYYSFPESELEIIKNAITAMRQLDLINRNEIFSGVRESESTVL